MTLFLLMGIFLTINGSWDLYTALKEESQYKKWRILSAGLGIDIGLFNVIINLIWEP